MAKKLFKQGFCESAELLEEGSLEDKQ